MKVEVKFQNGDLVTYVTETPTIEKLKAEIKKQVPADRQQALIDIVDAGAKGNPNERRPRK